MVNVPCPIAGCNYETGDYPATIVAALLSAHTAGTHVAGAAIAHQPKPPKVDRPELTDGIDEETWNAFHQSLKIFIQANRIQNADLAVQLYSCCKSSLKSKITAVNPDFLERPSNELLNLLKGLTVIPVAKTVKQNELFQMEQTECRRDGQNISLSSQRESCHMSLQKTMHPPPCRSAKWWSSP